MKKDSIYFHHGFGCLIYIIDVQEDNIIFSAASYLNDVFTTIMHYECKEWQLKNITELTDENFEIYTVYKKLGSRLSIKADGAGQSYKFSTELNFKHCEHRNISNKLKNWSYEQD